MSVAAFLEKKLIESDKFAVLTDIKHLPVVVVTLTEKAGDVNVFMLSDELRKNGWIVPAYTLPANAEHIQVLRIVVKENFTRDMAEMLTCDIMDALDRLVVKKHHKAPIYDEKTNRIC